MPREYIPTQPPRNAELQQLIASAWGVSMDGTLPPDYPNREDADPEGLIILWLESAAQWVRDNGLRSRGRYRKGERR